MRSREGRSQAGSPKVAGCLPLELSSQGSAPRGLRKAWVLTPPAQPSPKHGCILPLVLDWVGGMELVGVSPEGGWEDPRERRRGL